MTLADIVEQEMNRHPFLFSVAFGCSISQLSERVTGFFTDDSTTHLFSKVGLTMALIAGSVFYISRQKRRSVREQWQQFNKLYKTYSNSVKEIKSTSVWEFPSNVVEDTDMGNMQIYLRSITDFSSLSGCLGAEDVDKGHTIAAKYGVAFSPNWADSKLQWSTSPSFRARITAGIPEEIILLGRQIGVAEEEYKGYLLSRYLIHPQEVIGSGKDVDERCYSFKK